MVGAFSDDGEESVEAVEETAVSAAASDAVCQQQQQQQQLQVPQSLQPCAQLTVFLLATTVGSNTNDRDTGFPGSASQKQ